MVCAPAEEGRCLGGAWSKSERLAGGRPRRPGAGRMLTRWLRCFAGGTSICEIVVHQRVLGPRLLNVIQTDRQVEVRVQYDRRNIK